MTARVEVPADRRPYRSGVRGGPDTEWRSRRWVRPALFLCLAAAFLVFALVVAFGAGGDSDPEPQAIHASHPHEDLGDTPAEVAPGRYIYALPLPALRGLPPDLRPGTLIELWVSWDPPLTDEPTVQRLLEDVRIHRVAPAIDPNSPDVALLDVAAEDVPDLIYGDRYGSLNATLAPQSI